MNAKNPIIAVIDGGGTYTRLWVVSIKTMSALEYSDCLASDVTGTMKQYLSQPDAYAALVIHLLQGMLLGIGCRVQDLDGIIIGSAGIGTPAIATSIRDAFMKQVIENHSQHKIFIDCRSDAELALIGCSGSLSSPCLLLNLGTGSIAVGRMAESKLYRAGGYGLPYSDEGSGTWVVQQFISKILRVVDSGLSGDTLVRKLEKKLSFPIAKQPREFLAFVKENEVSVTEAVLALLENKQLKNHPMINQLLEGIAEAGASLVQTLSMRMLLNYHIPKIKSPFDGLDDMRLPFKQFPVYLTGSVARNPKVLPLLKQQILALESGTLYIEEPVGNPMTGGVLLYAKHIGIKRKATKKKK
ncbi:MAG: hypothetical protein JNL32_14310 [Candidatus Kapabacteria bacterium]|nr:hypothetical protein [Candidatus Kapabacteria bacterium]